ncbi:hypothetical protein M0R45_023785 [Rubus argutus]|uniref:KRR-R motif-containing protein 1 n=1 Tax=Rubus argutus TaxID=59490 RepID=A0AAW1WQK2_RUBAR
MEICGRYQSDKPGGGTYEFTSFTTYFAEYQLPKLSDSFSMVESALAEHGITYKLDLVKRYMIVITNERTKDPDMIHRARELIRLLSKTDVSPSMAIEILNGNLHHDFIKTGHQDGGLSKIHGISDERFAKRRNRFVKNLKGNSVTAAGTSLVHVKVVRKIVERCFVDNVNPAAVVKSLN